MANGLVIVAQYVLFLLPLGLIFGRGNAVVGEGHRGGVFHDPPRRDRVA